MTRPRLRLRHVPRFLRDRARKAFESGDVVGFFCTASNEVALDLLFENGPAFKSVGLFEQALLEAFNGTRTNNARWSMHEMDLLFGAADRGKLRAAGDPLPSDGPFTVYRGVAGVEPFRKEPGYSWTASPGLAAWFATRYGLEDPAVLVTEATADEVLAYLDSEEKGRGEAEFLLRAMRWDRLGPMPKPDLPA